MANLLLDSWLNVVEWARCGQSDSSPDLKWLADLGFSDDLNAGKDRRQTELQYLPRTGDGDGSSRTQTASMKA